MQLNDRAANVIGGAYSLAAGNPCMGGEAVRRDAALRMASLWG